MKCPQMSATQEEWNKYYLSQWEELTNDDNSPEWLKNLSKHVISESVNP
jgi:hypothetical protein